MVFNQYYENKLMDVDKTPFFVHFQQIYCPCLVTKMFLVEISGEQIHGFGKTSYTIWYSQNSHMGL